MNYEKMLNEHIASGADASIAVLEVPMKEASRFGILNTDGKGKVIEFEEKPKKPKSNLASMGIYIFTYKTLKKYLKEDAKTSESDHDFGKNIIPAYLNDKLSVHAYNFKGYWKDVGTIESLWEANMDLLKDNNSLDLFDGSWKIYTDDAGIRPQCFGPKAKVNNAFITQGAVINGEVNRSVLFTGAEIKEGAKVFDSVIMNDVVVGNNVRLNRCLVMDDVKIPAGMTLGKKNSEDILLVTRDLIEEKGAKKDE